MKKNEFKTVDASILKKINISLVKECFETGESYSKQAVADLTQLSFPTVSRVIDEMVKSNELLESGKESSSGGRRAFSYTINADKSYSLIITVHHKKIMYSLYNALYKRILSNEIAVLDKIFYPKIIECIEKYSKSYNLGSISLGVPGSVFDGNIQEIDTFEDLRQIPIQKELNEMFNIPVVLENDINAACLGLFNSNKNHNNFEDTLACLFISENGPGCGFIVNEKVYHGFSGFAGEIGYNLYKNNISFQEMIINHLSEIDKTDFIAKLLICIISTINPKKIVIFKSFFCDNISNELIKKVQNHIPANGIPKIVFCEEFFNNYEKGLLELAKDVSRETFFVKY